jgi:signal transduction histidine kinase
MVLTALLDQLGPDAFLVSDAGTITFANVIAHRLLGGRPGTLIGTALSRWVPAGELARVETVLAQRTEAFPDLPETFRLQLVNAGGQPVIVDARFSRRDAIRVFSFRDATAIARGEALVSRLATLSRAGRGLLGADAVLDAAEPVFDELGWRGAFTRIVPDGSVTLRSVAGAPGDPVVDYARTLIGRLIPRGATPVLSQVMQEGRALFLDNLPGFLAGPVSAAERLSQSLTAGHAYRSAWCPVRDPHGEITHLLSIAGKGMTERDFLALQLFAAQLGEANELSQLRIELVQRERLAAVGEMSAVLAHEMRNPLGVVFNAANGLRRTVAGEPAQTLLNSLMEEAERLRRLTTDLLDFARPASPPLVPVALGPLLAEVAAAARTEPTARRARVELRLPPVLPLVLADEVMLRRALLNLAVNAFQHVSEGGLVTLSAEVAGDEVRLRVENEGLPIPPEVGLRLFEPFFTTRAAGSGLGLAVVKKVMDELHGKVAHEPRETGACFVASLPVVEPEPEGALTSKQ